MSVATSEVETKAATAGPDLVAALAEVDRATRRRRWPLVALGLAFGVGGTLAALTFLDRRSDSIVESAADVVLATAPVEGRDLIEEIEWTGTLGYGEPVAIAGGGGVVTETVAVGTVIERGDAVAEVDAEPIVAFFGDTPLWRTVAEGDSGADVRQIEANLVTLGYDPDETVSVDDTFTANTEAMVERWQEDLGIEVTGRIATSSVVIIDGPSVITSAAEPGAAATGATVTLTPRRIVDDVMGGPAGTITDLASIGSAIEHGTVLYTVDKVPVLALVDRTRSWSGDTGADQVVAALVDPTFTNLELEQALAADGHDPDGDMTVDGVVTAATVAALERWQTAADLPVTGSPDPAYYVAVSAGRTVEAHLVEDGSIVLADRPVLTLSQSRLAIALVVDVADADEFELGQEVTVELADETTVSGAVIEIGPVVQSANQASDPTVEITIGLTDRTGTDPVEGPVTILSAGEVVNGATVVPTRALITLAEGGFAVERVEPDGSATLIGIELGNFDDGVVEVVTGDLEPGDEVVVPQ
jgi:peptidoglycan hydrolase-like protein with peptidoglycan-binding domain